MFLYLSIGSNLGDRQANLETALSRLRGIFGPEIGRSSVVETKAYGFVGPDFLNTVAAFESSARPEDILDACKEVERSMGRSDAPEYDGTGARVYHDRIIDIDILEYGDLEISSPALTIPHPQVTTRPFVRPLLEEAKSSIGSAL